MNMSSQSKSSISDTSSMEDDKEKKIKEKQRKEKQISMLLYGRESLINEENESEEEEKKSITNEELKIKSQAGDYLTGIRVSPEE